MQRLSWAEILLEPTGAFPSRWQQPPLCPLMGGMVQPEEGQREGSRRPSHPVHQALGIEVQAHGAL